MDRVLTDLYRKQSRAQSQQNLDRLQEAAQLREQILLHEDRQVRRGSLSQAKEWVKKIRHDSSGTIERQLNEFKTRVGAVPGFEDLQATKSSTEILCWSLILIVLIVLTGYSFVRLITDYLGLLHFYTQHIVKLIFLQKKN